MVQLIKNKSRTVVGNFVHSVWTGLNIRCSNGKYFHLRTTDKCLRYETVLIKMSREEFKDFCISNKNIIESLTRPSLDRIDDKGDYSIGNIQIIELGDNIRKSKMVFKDGVIKCCCCGEIKEFGLFCIDKRLSVGRSTLCKACYNKRRLGKYKRRVNRGL